MAKIQANTPGIAALNHDYGTAPLGKLANRTVNVNGAQLHFKSAKRNPVKSLLSRMADVLPGNNGKVRSFNRAHKEFSLQLGDTLGSIAGKGHLGPLDGLEKSLGKLFQLDQKLDSKLAGFDSKSHLTTRLQLSVSRMNAKQLSALWEGVRDQSISSQGAKARLDKVETDLDSIGLGGTGIVSRTQQEMAPALKEELKFMRESLQEVKSVVLNELASIKSKNLGIPKEVALEVYRSGGSDKEVEAWGKTGIRPPALSAFIAAGVTPTHATLISAGGKTVADFQTLQGQPYNLTADQAAASLRGGVDAAEIGRLVLSGLSMPEALKYAEAGCTLAFKTSLAQKQPPFSEDEILGLAKHGLTNADATALGAFRASDINPANISKANGGASGNVYKVVTNGPNGPVEQFFSIATNDLFAGALDKMEKIEPGLVPGAPVRLADRNVASFKLDQLMNAGLVARTDYASLNTPDGVKVGTAMTRARGRAAQDCDTRSKGNWTPAADQRVADLNNQFNGDLAAFNRRLEGDGKVMRLEPTTGKYELSDLENIPHDVSISNPQLRKQMILLQYMDALMGQVDRSPGNYFIDVDRNGNVVLTAIDNDLGWGTEPHDKKSYDKLSGYIGAGGPTLKALPPIADAAIIQMFQALTPQALQATLGNQLSPAQLQAAEGRLALIQDHLRTLQPAQIVADWGAGADAAISAGLNNKNSYLMRDQRFFKPSV